MALRKGTVLCGKGKVTYNFLLYSSFQLSLSLTRSISCGSDQVIAQQRAKVYLIYWKIVTERTKFMENLVVTFAFRISLVL